MLQLRSLSNLMVKKIRTLAPCESSNTGDLVDHHVEYYSIMAVFADKKANLIRISFTFDIKRW